MNKIFKLYTLDNKISAQFKFTLTPLELKEFIDFEIKRIYIIGNSEGGETSQHCHLEEKEFFIVVQGSCVAVIDKGDGLEEIDGMWEDAGTFDSLFRANTYWAQKHAKEQQS